jgi:ribosomal protein L37AE/L43A
MPQLIVADKIDGIPVTWRCSQCRQIFFARGEFTAQERLAKATEEFKTHLEQSHNIYTATA